MNNANLPPIRVSVPPIFLGLPGESSESGHLISVRAMLNQALQFSVLLDSGALYTGLPAHALYHNIRTDDSHIEDYGLSDAQAYDCIGSDIEVITLQHLLYMPCTVKPFRRDGLWGGVYLFTIDFVDPVGLPRHPEQWKMSHCVALASGNFAIYPQYRIRFSDGAFCPNSNKPFPKYGYNETIWLAE